MTITRNQAKDKVPIKLVSEQPDELETSYHHSNNHENGYQDDSNLSKPDLDDENEFWARQEHINERTTNASAKLQAAQQELHNSHQKLHQTLREKSQEMNRQVDS